MNPNASLIASPRNAQRIITIEEASNGFIIRWNDEHYQNHVFLCLDLGALSAKLSELFAPATA